jgi:hypothetical protein
MLAGWKARGATVVVSGMHRWLFVAGVVSALIYAILGPQPPIRGGGEMVAIAQNLARTGVFGNPFVMTLNTGPTAVVPPLYPAFIALLIKILGNSGAWIVLAGGVVLVHGLHASLLPRLSSLIYADPRPGIYGAIVSVLLPVYSWMPYWDAMYAAAGLMLFCVASAWWIRSQWPLAPIASGLSAGVLALMNPLSALVSVAWILFLLRDNRGSVKSRLHFCAMFAAVLAIAILPWSLRNYRQFGTFSLKTNFGMTVYASNNDCASSAMINNLESGCYATHHPYGSVAEAQLLKSLGEAGYDRYRTAATIKWVRDHRDRFIKLTTARVVEFWFPNPAYGWYGRSIWLITALSIPGVLYMIRRGVRAIYFVAVVFLTYPCAYYLVVSDYRYRYPILWLSLLVAGYCVETIRTGAARQ